MENDVKGNTDDVVCASCKSKMQEWDDGVVCLGCSAGHMDTFDIKEREVNSDGC